MLSPEAEERPTAKDIYDYFMTGKTTFEDDLVHFAKDDDNAKEQEAIL